jgi:hypothetical protein
LRWITARIRKQSIAVDLKRTNAPGLRPLNRNHLGCRLAFGRKEIAVGCTIGGGEDTRIEILTYKRDSA